MNNCEHSLNKCGIIHVDKECNLVVEDNTFNCNYVQVYIAKLTTTSGSMPTQVFIKDSRNKKIKFPTTKDGFYTICKLTIPLDESMPYYYKDGRYYHNVQEVYLQELVNVNPEISKIKIDYMYYFSTCNLRKCFINICQKIFKQSSSLCNSNNVDSSLTYKRDLVWSALNVIKYMTEMNLYEEAQQLLEEISGCNGLCAENPVVKSSNCGCGR